VFVWDVFLEPADTDEPPRFIGTIQGTSQAQALETAAQFYERQLHDLVVRRQPTSAAEADAQAIRVKPVWLSNKPLINIVEAHFTLCGKEVVGLSLNQRENRTFFSLPARGDTSGEVPHLSRPERKTCSSSWLKTRGFRKSHV
jgi:hypothetical protein